MHTTGHTNTNGRRSQVRHTIFRTGSYYYNRRVPEHAIEACGAFIRVRLSSDATEATQLSERLTESLNAIWKHDEIEHGIDVHTLLKAARPRSFTLGQLSDEYLSLRSIDPPRCGKPSGPSSLLLATRISKPTTDRMPEHWSLTFGTEGTQRERSDDE
jgi:hypothetical protein